MLPFYLLTIQTYFLSISITNFFFYVGILSLLRTSRGIPWLWNEVINEEGGFCAPRPQPQLETNSCSGPDNSYSFFTHVLALYLPLFLGM